MANWRTLSEPGWRSHRLNRVGGLLGAGVAVLIATHMLFHAGLAFVMQLAFVEGIDADRAFADATIWAFPLYAALAAGSTIALLWSIWTRWRYAPELNAAVVLLVIVMDQVQLALDGSDFLGASWEERVLSLVVYALTVLFAVYLFVGRRPNVMFRRRERAS